MASSKHGAIVRGMDNVPHSSIRDQRFGRMFRFLPAADFDENALIALGETMQQGEFADRIGSNPPQPVDNALNTHDPDENPEIPAGYTYLGQFIDHDITFDPASSLDRFNDPDALQDFRTPRLDLDSVYGSGPADQPFLYEGDEAHLLLGDDRDFDPPRRAKPDLPRNRHFDEDLPLEDQKPRRALIGDKRNDENLIVSQLHATFLRFHNKVLDTEGEGDFAKTQQIVRWHYQWIVLHDFLRRIVGKDTYEKVVGGRGQVPTIKFYEAKGRYAYIPVEFSVAAYRFGHSMVRPSYALNSLVRAADPHVQPFAGQMAEFNRIPIFSLVQPSDGNGGRANLNGFRVLPDLWSIDWGFFFNVPPHPSPLRPLNGDEILPQPSYKLDTTLVDPLTFLPDHVKLPPHLQSLAILNLLRGWRMGLPSGQSVARNMSLKDVPVLTDDELFDGDRSALLLPDEKGKPSKFIDNCPLWFYIPREAEILGNSQHLGPVGGTIVAEVLAGLIVEDRFSFLSQWPTWKPFLPAAENGHFTMADLINYTEAVAAV